MTGGNTNKKNKKETQKSSSDATDTEMELSAQEIIDFSPVYRCSHIYTVVGSRQTFETYYRAQRTSQANLVLQPPSNMVFILIINQCTSIFIYY